MLGWHFYIIDILQCLLCLITCRGENTLTSKYFITRLKSFFMHKFMTMLFEILQFTAEINEAFYYYIITSYILHNINCLCSTRQIIYLSWVNCKYSRTCAIQHLSFPISCDIRQNFMVRK